MNAEENDVFLQKLDKHPRLKKRFNEILGIAENSSRELITADDAEMKAIEEVKKLGQEIVQEWAINQHEKAIENTKRDKPQVKKDTKKTLLAINIWTNRNRKNPA
jgi:hypothetical protein